MLEQEFERLYLKFRLRHFQTLFQQIKEKAGSLSATEAYSAEVIYLLNRPTVKEFADFLGISQPNATYKVGNLVTKGYLKKDPSPEDRREYRLEVTDKFLSYYCGNSPFIAEMLKNIRSDFTPEEIHQLEEIIRRVTDEAMKPFER